MENYFQRNIYCFFFPSSRGLVQGKCEHAIEDMQRKTRSPVIFKMVFVKCFQLNLMSLLTSFNGSGCVHPFFLLASRNDVLVPALSLAPPSNYVLWEKHFLDWKWPDFFSTLCRVNFFLSLQFRNAFENGAICNKYSHYGSRIWTTTAAIFSHLTANSHTFLNWTDESPRTMLVICVQILLMDFSRGNSPFKEWHKENYLMLLATKNGGLFGDEELRIGEVECGNCLNLGNADSSLLVIVSPL